MNILYDYQIFQLQKYGGISRYFYELLRNSDDLFEYKIGGRFSDNIYSKELKLMRSFPLSYERRGVLRCVSFFNKQRLKRDLKSNDYDIFHPTYYFADYSNIKRPAVITVYDMIHELFPQYFLNDDTIKSKSNAINNSDLIIAISESTKNDLIRLYPNINPNKIIVTYLGNPFDVVKMQDTDTVKNYILFTGSRGTYKNFELFVKAIAPLLIKYGLELKCTGMPFNSREIGLLKDCNIYEKSQAIYATEEELPYLYAKALAFVFPSLYEGFGFPVLESFSSGCPLIVSNTSSLLEISGDAAMFFDPNSIDDMRRTVEKVIISDSLRKEMIEKGYKQRVNFSWEKCAKETNLAYTKLINDRLL